MKRDTGAHYKIFVQKETDAARDALDSNERNVDVQVSRALSISFMSSLFPRHDERQLTLPCFSISPSRGFPFSRLASASPLNLLFFRATDRATRPPTGGTWRILESRYFRSAKFGKRIYSSRGKVRETAGNGAAPEPRISEIARLIFRRIFAHARSPLSDSLRVLADTYA